MVKQLRVVGVSVISLLLWSSAYGNLAYAKAEGSLTRTIAPDKKEYCTGIVTDATGLAVIGATVRVKGTQNGVVTDMDGKFMLRNVAKGSTIEISYIGYKTKFVVWNGKRLNLTLLEDKKSLDEVVVVGYGSSTKRDLISSVSTVKTEQLANIPTTNMAQGLAGRSPGLIVKASGGGINATPSISIRGGGAPIYVIDGVIRSAQDFMNLSSEDIENMSILKDASATAVYGSRATNGIIQVTTKKGRAGKMSISYDFNTSFAQPNIWPEQMDIWDQAKYANIGAVNDGKTPVYTEEAIQKFRDGSEPESFSNTKWRDVVLNKWAKQQKHSVRLTGGFGKSRYFLSLGHVNQNSMYKSGTNWMKRTNFRSSISTYLDKFDLRVNATLDGYRQSNNHPYSSKLSGYYQTFSWINNLSPALPARNKFGLPYNLKENPLSETSADAGNIRGINNVINGKGELIWGIPKIKGLKLRLATNYRFYSETEKKWRKDPAQYNWDSKVAVYAEKPLVRHKAASGYSFTNQAFLDYNGKFGKHTVSALAGFEQSYTKGEDYWGQREHYAFAIPQMSVGDANSQTNGGYEYEIGRAAYIGVLKYNYDSRYYVEGNLRRDGSDYFAPDKRWGTFFSGSMGWLVTSEKFMKALVDKNILNLLKFRASYGETGLDSSAGRWAYMTSYNLDTQSYVVNGEFVPGFSEGSMPSPDLTWYTTKQTDFGFDFASLNNRLYGSFDYFYYSTKGYLMAPTGESYLNTIIGIGLPKVKSESELRRDGVELQLGWRDHIGDFSYDISTNYTYFNELWALNEAEGEAQEMNPYQRTQQHGGYYGLLQHNLGYYKSADDVINSPADLGAMKTGYLTAGDLKYEDVNGDGQIDGSDKRRRGKSTFPRGQFGLNINLGYKGFYFSTLFQGSTSFDMYIPGSAAMQTGQTSDRAVRYDYQTDFWTIDNRNAQYPRLMSNTGLNGNNNYASSDFWLVDGAYLRMKDFQFGYDFKHTLLREFKYLTKVKLGISGQNLFTVSKATKYGLDPETSSTSGYGYPVERIIALSLNLGF